MPGSNIPYIPGHWPASPGPLSRYLPPLPEGVVTTWLEQHIPAGTWVIDPFGASPRLAVEAARAGYRVLVAANNPVLQFLLEMTVRPPSEIELSSALAELASSYRGSERIEPHIRALYTAECSHCSSPVTVESYLWERQASSPYARIYRCQSCGDSGERPVSSREQERAAQFAGGGLHRARALERVAPKDDPDRLHAEEALAVYLPRAVYSLFTLINKLDGLQVAPDRRRSLDALLIFALDQGNTLWQHPVARDRPKQLTIPPKFRENNVWLALEGAIPVWAAARQGEEIPLAYWPEPPPASGGICLFEGRLKDLATSLSGLDIGAVLTALPRPNQAFWTLSALWSGWLWGREAASSLKAVLRRRRYDWGWHMTALSAAIAALSPHLAPATPFFAMMGEAEPGFLTAALMAVETAGYDLQGVALRPESGQCQITWRKAEYFDGSSQVKATQAEQISRQAAVDYLTEHRQPSLYLPMHASALSALADAHAFQVAGRPDHTQNELTPYENFNQVQSVLKETFTYRNGFLRYEGSEQSLDVGLWWLNQAKELILNKKESAPTPQADRVEIALVRYLYRHPGCTELDLDRDVCAAFLGLHTPERKLVGICLDSYGELVEPGSSQWRLREQDEPEARRTDIRNARQKVVELGKRLGFRVDVPEKGEGAGSAPISSLTPIIWLDAQGIRAAAFYILASAAFGEIVFKSPAQPGKSIIVLPGSRSNLVEFKLRANPFLKQEVEKGWIFLKYRHLHRLMDSPLLNQDNLDEYIGLDPLTFTDVQMRLL